MNSLQHELNTPHYYGDTVRLLFMIAGIIMLVTLPSFSKILNVPVIVSVASILILALSAGLTNPKQKWDATVNVVIASVGFLVFETFGVLAYGQGVISKQGEFFVITNIGLGLLFLVALYFGVKTLRGLYLKGENHARQE